MKVTSTLNAWKEAQKHIHNYELDREASANAGYNIYRGDEGHIGDLDARLEVNLDDGTTLNIWISDEPAETAAGALEKYISVEVKLDTQDGTRHATETDEATIYINAATTLSAVAAYGETVSKMLKRAQRCAARGGSAMISLYAQAGDRGDLWTAYGDAVSADGVYLTPSATNANPAHDIMISRIDALNILRELSI